MQTLNKNTPTKTAFIGAILTLVGGFFISYNYIESKKIVAYDYMSNAFYNGSEIVEITEEEATNKKVEDKEEDTPVTNDYIG